MTELHYAVTVIQENRAIPIRRVSGSKVIFLIKEGNQQRYFLYSKTLKVVEPLDEAVALLCLKDKVNFVHSGVTYTGSIIAVVPPKQSLVGKIDALKAMGYRTDVIVADMRRRQQRSYLIAVGKTLYWPMVSTIRKLNV